MCSVIVMDDPNPLVWQHGGRTICNLIQWISLAKRLDDLDIRKHIRMLNANWQHSRPYWENEDPTRDCLVVPSSHVLGNSFFFPFFVKQEIFLGYWVLVSLEAISFILQNNVKDRSCAK